MLELELGLIRVKGLPGKRGRYRGRGRSCRLELGLSLIRVKGLQCKGERKRGGFGH